MPGNPSDLPGPTITVKRPYEFKSEKLGRMILYGKPCLPRCERGSWDAETGSVECSRCSRVFDPDWPEPEPCAGCKEPITDECWGKDDGDGETFYCDGCAGFKVG